MVNELSRADKHRTTQPVHPVPERMHLNIGPQTDCLFRRSSLSRPRGILEPGAELVRLYVKKTGPNPVIDVKPSFTIDPAINARLTLEEFLKRTIRTIGLVLVQFSPQAPEAQRILKDRSIKL